MSLRTKSLSPQSVGKQKKKRGQISSELMADWKRRCANWSVADLPEGVWDILQQHPPHGQQIMDMLKQAHTLAACGDIAGADGINKIIRSKVCHNVNNVLKDQGLSVISTEGWSLWKRRKRRKEEAENSQPPAYPPPRGERPVNRLPGSPDPLAGVKAERVADAAAKPARRRRDASGARANPYEEMRVRETFELIKELATARGGGSRVVASRVAQRIRQMRGQGVDSLNGLADIADAMLSVVNIIKNN